MKDASKFYREVADFINTTLNDFASSGLCNPADALLLEVKCDEENNPSQVLDAGNVIIQLSLPVADGQTLAAMRLFDYVINGTSGLAELEKDIRTVLLEKRRSLRTLTLTLDRRGTTVVESIPLERIPDLCCTHDFHVVCDESNNSKESIDKGELVVDITLTPRPVPALDLSPAEALTILTSALSSQVGKLTPADKEAMSKLASEFEEELKDGMRNSLFLRESATADEHSTSHSPEQAQRSSDRLYVDGGHS